MAAVLREHCGRHGRLDRCRRDLRPDCRLRSRLRGLQHDAAKLDYDESGIRLAAELHRRLPVGRADRRRRRGRRDRAAAAGEGSLIVGGYFGGTADLDPGPPVLHRTSQGQADTFILKLDVANQLAWLDV